MSNVQNNTNINNRCQNPFMYHYKLYSLIIKHKATSNQYDIAIVYYYYYYYYYIHTLV
jgi:hypothetical protein